MTDTLPLFQAGYSLLCAEMSHQFGARMAVVLRLLVRVPPMGISIL